MTQNPGSCYQDLGRASAVQSSDYRHITLTHVSCGPMTGNTSIISGPSTWAVIRQMFLLLRNLTLTRWIQVWKKLWDFCRLWRDPRKFHFINGPLPLAHLLLLIVWAMFFSQRVMVLWHSGHLSGKGGEQASEPADRRQFWGPACTDREDGLFQFLAMSDFSVWNLVYLLSPTC